MSRYKWIKLIGGDFLLVNLDTNASVARFRPRINARTMIGLIN